MAERDYTQIGTGRFSATAATVDAGLRRFMIGVYNYMLGALGLTGLVSFYIGQQYELLYALANSGLMWVVLLAPLGLAFFMGWRINTMSVRTAQTVFWLFSVLIAVGLSPIFLTHTNESIARTFFITAATFGGMSLYGYTTKRDLTSIGSFLIMGVWGLIVASLVNIFLGSSLLGYAISCLGVLIFTGLAAYDTQKIKESYYSADSPEIAAKKSIFGALNLYMDFINLFISLLRLIGERR